MDTPIFDFVQEYIRRGEARLHMPGHKGRPFLGCEALDITEIEGADSLGDARGIIGRSEDNATRLFGTKHSFYSAGGSSQCVKAMLLIAMLCSNHSGGSVLAARNVHRSFIDACAMLDIEVEWLYPEEGAGSSPCTCYVRPAALGERLDSMDRPPFAVYVTSPDYLGIQQDLAGLARECKKRGVPLLVDNAHGAYLKFLPYPAHPMELGAAMCCDSAHKTLPVLTGGAYLHIAEDVPEDFVRRARSALALFGSTSPSYLILQSLDLCNLYLRDGYREKLERCVGQTDALRAFLREAGLVLYKTDPLKLTIDAAASNCSGRQIASRLRERRAVCEYSDERHAVLMFTPENSEEDFSRVREALQGPFSAERVPSPPTALPTPGIRAMSIRSAMLSRHETVPAELAAGRVCASPVFSCPPAVPLCVSGELILPETAALFRLYGIDRVEVVQES